MVSSFAKDRLSACTMSFVAPPLLFTISVRAMCECVKERNGGRTLDKGCMCVPLSYRYKAMSVTGVSILWFTNWQQMLTIISFV